jgi:hypothetical protein
MPGNKRNKVTKYPRSLNINIGMIIFAVILVYVIICVFIYFNSKHIVGYEVMEGSLSTDNIYEGIALRNEEVVKSKLAGYVNYFATEGRRVAVGNLVYTVDESGQLLDELKAQGTNDVTLSDDDLSELRSQIVDFSSGFQPAQFNSVYDFKTSMTGTVQKLANASILKNIQSLNDSSKSQSINYCNAEDTGIVVYSTDGFEQTKLENLTAAMFDDSKYTKTQLVNNALVSVGDPVYKLSTDETWSVAIKTDAAKAKELTDLGYVKVRFLKNQDESWAAVTSYTNDAGDTFVDLTFTNSMLTFATDRYLNIELITEDQKGLKIPNSSIVKKNFFIVPKEYVTTGQDNKTGVMRDTYTEDGKETTEFVQTQIYNETDTEYYLDDSTLRSGDILIKPESTEKYTISKQDSLIGVYNINKGYADFKQINILYQNNEYSIVQSNTQYGLNVYDYIVLDTSTVNENELIYE